MELSSPALVSSFSAHPARLRVLRWLVAGAMAIAVWSQLVPNGWPLSTTPVQKQAVGAARGKCVVFNFGDSNSDTGGLVPGAGFRLHGPVGRRFFGKPAGRFCDGRLYIDFLCERLGLDHLSPYMESSGVSFRHGANFAAAGATTGGAGESSPFGLATQVRQFRHFKARTADLLRRGLGSGITREQFENAVYTFDIGQNDIQVALGAANISDERVLESIPAIIARIKNAVTMVHETGGRKFVLYNTGPLGCLPSTLARWGRLAGGGGELDGAGCLARHNGVAMAFNARLRRLCGELRATLPGGTVVCVDMYAIKYGLFANHTAHGEIMHEPPDLGFTEPLMACCGSGGPPYNYRAGTACGSPKAKACADGDRRISWDGLHYTEAANRIVADQILSSKYSDPPLRLQTLCGT
ncbi:hypothetical protein ACP70R_005115 [Stipagrostis hirtigluma subsp. patula]